MFTFIHKKIIRGGVGLRFIYLLLICIFTLQSYDYVYLNIKLSSKWSSQIQIAPLPLLSNS